MTLVFDYQRPCFWGSKSPIPKTKDKWVSGVCVCVYIVNYSDYINWWKSLSINNMCRIWMGLWYWDNDPVWKYFRGSIWCWKWLVEKGNSWEMHCKKNRSLRIQICPKKGINPTVLLWGWDWDHQSYSREGFGFLGDIIHKKKSGVQLNQP